MTQSRQFPPMPEIGKPESFYAQHVHAADKAGDIHAHEAYKVGQYVTLAMDAHPAAEVRIDARHIPVSVTRRALVERPADRFGSLQEVREAAEREYIQKKLEEANGNVTRTAEMLGLERSNLYRKMKTLGIAPKE